MRRRRLQPIGKQANRRVDGGEQGFTLLELVIVLVILPLIIGGIAAAVIAEIDNTSQADPRGAYQKLADSHDSQITSAYFARDVQSTALVSAAASPVLCHPTSVTGGYQLLGLEWPSLASQTSGATKYDVSYFVQQSPPELVRYYCAAGAYVSQSVVSYGSFRSLPSISLNQAPACGSASSCAVNNGHIYASATVTCTNGVTCANAGLSPVIPATAGGIGITNVSINVADNQSTGYHYNLTAAPRLANSVVNGNPPSNPPVAPFIINGSVDAGNCGILANGLVSVNQSTGTALNLGPKGSLQATYLNTSGGTVSGSSGQYPAPVLHDGPVASPYDKLVEPPTVPAGRSYSVVTINTPNWDPSSLPQPLTPAIYVVTNGLKVTGNNALNASSGVLFYVTGGPVTLGGQGTILLNSLDSASPYWEKTTDGSSAPMPEVVLWISKSDSGATLTLGGNGGAVTINGAVYAPTATTTLNGGGSSGGISTQSLTTGPVTCNGGGSGTTNVTVGSPLSSGTLGSPAANPISLGMADQDSVTVLGAGHLAPTGTVSVWECGPQTPSATGCTSSTPGAVRVSSALALTPNSANGTATAISPPVTPAVPGWYCFATYYSGNSSYLLSRDEAVDGCFYDSPPPTVVIAAPTANGCYASTPNLLCTGIWAGSIAGTSAEPGGPGVQKVTFTLQEPVDNKYWNGTSFASTTPVPLTAITSDGWATWSFPFPTSDFSAGRTGIYTVTATATDANNLSSSPVSETFTWQG